MLPETRDNARMTIASRRHQHPVCYLPAIIDNPLAGQRGHLTIRFLHDQMSRRKIPIATISAGEGRVEITLRDPAEPERQ